MTPTSGICRAVDCNSGGIVGRPVTEECVQYNYASMMLSSVLLHRHCGARGVGAGCAIYALLLLASFAQLARR
jgi:hypothetical protein